MGCLDGTKGSSKATSLISATILADEVQREMSVLITDDEKCGSSTELHHRRFRLDMKKNFFTVRVLKS